MTEATVFLERKGLSIDEMYDGLFQRLKMNKTFDFLHNFVIREEFFSKFGCAVLDQPTVELIAQYGPILEIGAGCGYWSYELRKAGVDVIATDAHPERWILWTEVLGINAIEAVKTFPDRTLLTVWAEPENWAAQALKKYLKNGKTVIYVGEGCGGATCNDEFFEILHSQCDLKRSAKVPKFFGIHDYLEIWARK